MRILILIAIFILSGCSVFSPVKTQTTNRYVMDATPKAFRYKQRHHQLVLLVTVPDAAPAYQTEKMIYSSLPYKLASYGENEWANTPAQMLEPLMINTLQDTHFFKAVVSAPFAGKYDYVLNTKVMSLLQDYTAKKPLLRFVLRAELLNAETHHLLAAHEWQVTQKMRNEGPYNGVIAANIASEKMLVLLREFVVQTIGSGE